ncbi:MAG: hypothetical protein CMJ85_02485 [Planctomycetes bacterium]|nr:hypothetical protein [Planctomycetota bacterium]MDP6424779.1 hypothetical protein [Planctomycetota bacterium]
MSRLALLALALVASCTGPRVETGEPIGTREPAAARPTYRPAPVTADRAELGFGSLFSRDDGDSVLASVSSVRVRKHHVFDRLLEIDPQRARELTELLVLDARVKVVAEKLDVQVPDSDLRLAVKREWARVERVFRQRSGGASTIDAWIERNYAMSRDAFLARVELLAWRRLLRSFTVRYQMRRRGGVAVQLFTAASAKAGLQYRGRIVEGADFATLARKHSVDRSAAVGGRLPLLPNGFDHPGVTLADEVAVGSLSQVRAIGERWGFVRVMDRRVPDTRPFAEAADEIRRELQRRPVESAELAVFIE